MQSFVYYACFGDFDTNLNRFSKFKPVTMTLIKQNHQNQRQFKDWERSSRYRHGPTQFLPDQLTKLTTEGAKSSWLLPHKHQCSQSFHVSANFRRFLAFLINFCTDSAAQSNNSAVNGKQRVNKSPFMAIFWEPDPESHGTLVLPRQCLTLSIFELDPTYGYEFDFS